MSEGDPGSGNKADDQSPETALRASLPGRRLFIFKATAILSGVAAFGFGRSAHGQTDFDVTDHGPKGKKGPVRGGGVTDKDPDDPEGGGRGGGQKRPRPVAGVTDKDPDDPEGGGRGAGGGKGGGGGRGPDRK